MELGDSSHLLIEQIDAIDGIAVLRAERMINVSLMIHIGGKTQQEFEVSFRLS